MNDKTRPDRYGVIGYPVHHSRSPEIHARFARETGQSLTYERIEATREEFGARVADFAAAGGKGLNVTVPHKQAAFEFAVDRGVEAITAGAVNTLSFGSSRPRGDNTDGAGLMRDLTANLGWGVRGRHVLIVGAGGATRGIVGPLLQASPASLCIANRTPSRAEAICGLFPTQEIRTSDLDQLEAIGSCELIINATSASLSGERPALSPSLITANTRCYDLAYSTGETPFTDWARTCGAATTAQGWGMLVEQAAESFRIWRGIRPSTQALITDLMRQGRQTHGK